MRRVLLNSLVLAMLSMAIAPVQAQQTEIISAYKCELYEYGDGNFTVPVCHIYPIEEFPYGAVRVPETMQFDGIDYKVVRVSGFSDLPELSDVELPSGLIAVSDSFNNCPMLSNITIHEGEGDLHIVQSFNKTNVNHIALPANLSSIYDSFNDNINIIGISIPAKVTHIVNSFNNCNLGRLEIGELKIYPNYNQMYGTSIKNSFKYNHIFGLYIYRPVIIEEPEFLNEIHTMYMYATINFYLAEDDVMEFPSLESLYIGGFATVSERFFTKAPKLTAVIISLQNLTGQEHRQLVHLGESVFDGCNLSYVTIMFENSEDFYNENARAQLYYAAKEIYGNNGEIVSYQSPFYNSGVKSVYIYGHFDMIEGFNSLSVGLFESVESIEVVNVIGTVSSSLFKNCKNLTTANLSKVTIIQNGAFAGCSSLESVSLPILSFGLAPDAFAGCTSLKTLFAATKYGSSLLGLNNCSSLKDLETVNMTSVENLSNCASLVELTFMEVTNIANEAFLNCKSLEKITFGPNLYYIGDNIFSGCTSLTDIFISAVNPPYCGNWGLVGENVCLHVPAESLDAYKEASDWKDFKNIEAWNPNTIQPQEFEEVDLGLSVLWAAENVGTSYMNLPGRYVDAASVATIDQTAVWRVPTIEEFEELFACEKILNHFDGSSIFFCGNDQVLTMPIAGSFLSSKSILDNMNKDGYYWVASETDSKYAHLFIDDEYSVIGQIADEATPTRMSLRLVRSKNDAGAEVVVCDSEDSKSEYYNLQGMKVSEPVKGQIYIEVKNGKGTKVKF